MTRKILCILQATCLVLVIIFTTGCGGGGGDPAIPSDPFTDDPLNDPSGIPHWESDNVNDREQVMEEYSVITSDGVGLYLLLHRPVDSSADNQYPGLLLIPGGLQAGHAWHARWRKSNAWEFVDAGMIVLTFDARGRGMSSGEENYNGLAGQDDLKEIIEWFNARDDIIPGGIGIATSSWGVTVAAGALGRNPELDVRFVLDLEGAHDRYVMTQWDDPMWVDIMHGHDTSDDEFWEHREAIRYIGDVTCPYFRIQSDMDHALDFFYVDHAIAMVNEAVAGASSYVQMNDMAPNVTYDPSQADTYHWYSVDDLDLIFFNSVLDAMSLTTPIS